MATATLQTPPSVIGDDELYEVIDGQRVRTRPMGIFAVWIASDLHTYLNHFARTHQLGRAVAEGLFHLPAPVSRDRRPDIAYVSYDQWPKTRSVPRRDNAWDVVPNLATEVVSLNDVVEELDEKIDEYFRVGVQIVWVVRPMQSMIHVYTSPTQITVLTKADTLDGGAVVPGFRLPLAELFSEGEAESNGTS
jgi:Uma2 family endonuclease